ncbi:MAG: polyhydroxyalkanoate depolymerase, partial [Sneathiella sp.]|nr:polyhydroxyalkanoate depolymerase [Sneathiella sp.]
VSVTLTGSAIDTRRHPTEPCKLAMNHSIEWFEHTVIHHVPLGYPGAFRQVYPGFMQLTGFVSMNFGRHMDAHMKQFDHLVQGDDDSADRHRAFYAEYNAVMDLTAEYYLQTIETVFQKQALAKGEMMYRNTRPVRTSAIEKTALMTVEGELDDISGIGQTVAAHDICTSLPDSMKTHYEQKGVGHYGVFNGSKFNKQIAPRISDFIRANEPKKAAKLELVPAVPAKAVAPKEATPVAVKKPEAAKVAAPTEVKAAPAKAEKPAPVAVKKPEAPKAAAPDAVNEAPVKTDKPAPKPVASAPVETAPKQAAVTAEKSPAAKTASLKSQKAPSKSKARAKAAPRKPRQPAKKA